MPEIPPQLLTREVLINLWCRYLSPGQFRREDPDTQVVQDILVDSPPLCLVTTMKAGFQENTLIHRWMVWDMFREMCFRGYLSTNMSGHTVRQWINYPSYTSAQNVSFDLSRDGAGGHVRGLVCTHRTYLPQIGRSHLGSLSSYINAAAYVRRVCVLEALDDAGILPSFTV